VTALTLERLRREGEAFMEEISRETYLAHSGLKTTVELQPIYQRHSAILGEDAFRFALESFKAAPSDTIERRSAKSLLEWELDAQASKALAGLEEREVAWESQATLRVNGREIPYQAAPIEIANSKDRSERLAIDEARASLASSEHSPIRLEYLQGERNVIESMGVAPDYNRSFEAVSGISLRELAGQCQSFLADTQSMWDDSLRHYLRAKVGIEPREAKRADALALFRASEFDAGFPASGMEPSIRRQVTEMGIDPAAGGRIYYDLGERAGKHARAFCAPVRVPAEVYLVLRPHGGQSDYNTLLHELGHALHFAYASADLPFEFRWLGDNSVTESYAMLLDHRMQDRGWLLRYTELGKNQVGEFLRMAGFEELHFLRRYSAKLSYEIAVYSGDIPWQSLPELYASKLTAATGFEYRAADAFIDMDPRYYSARYLRAWQLQSALNEYLTRRFDVDWHRNPAAGPWIVGDLFSTGQRDTADEIGARLGATLSFQPIIRKIEALLEG
jgi:Peptidase family M3